MDGQEDEMLIRLEGVSYRYPSGTKQALRGFSLRVRRGEIVGVVGATGAGKTTFCLTFNGIVPQFFGGEFFGSVTVAGEDTIDVPTSRLARHVGMVFEDPEAQISATTVAEETAFALENLGIPTADIQRRVADALRAVGLDGLESKHPTNLSGGQKQRLSIASALALSPDLIVLDEPTSQLDPVATAEVFKLVRTLNAEQGVTFVIASHASEELAEIADRILVLEGGRVALEGKPDEVFSKIPELRALRVRPPDIATSWTATRKVRTPPVTLDDAIRRTQELELSAPAVRPPIQPSNPVREATAALSASELCHVYPDGTRALDSINLSVGRGEFVAIAGRNGSGKSTLVRHFLGLLRPTSGRASIGDEDVTTLGVSELARRIGYIPQNAHQNIFCDSVANEVAFALIMLGHSRKDAETRVERALASMDLAWAAARHPMSLSRGDRLRVAIAAVLALDPTILIFDEPTIGQDWHGAEAILDVLSNLNRQGATVLLITHHLYLLPGRLDRLVMLDGGRKLFDGSLRDGFYDNTAMAAAGLQPPQTVRFAQSVAALAAHRPLGSVDMQRLLGGSERAA
jgi:energy-coupling factor transport system ATP-binding protein